MATTRDHLYIDLRELQKDLRSFPVGSPFYKKTFEKIQELKKQLGEQGIEEAGWDKNMKRVK